jgi:hypothetical protein
MLMKNYSKAGSKSEEPKLSQHFRRPVFAKKEHHSWDD